MQYKHLSVQKETNSPYPKVLLTLAIITKDDVNWVYGNGNNYRLKEPLIMNIYIYLTKIFKILVRL